ncbi:hypothetical protein JAAARDRAFT_61650 [Jaapia argillacea MUCL 33604]|uniref:Secreted protein n=1 Tax=Jaapia argillacea MUCL 33604 TaxID=933084 RepID=A0A067PDI3_9AGAM|nr:hypothetical protein JAAARDRAFT_61650 [Jaapia argillacea MUCL 33604]
MTMFLVNSTLIHMKCSILVPLVAALSNVVSYLPNDSVLIRAFFAPDEASLFAERDYLHSRWRVRVVVRFGDYARGDGFGGGVPGCWGL